MNEGVTEKKDANGQMRHINPKNHGSTDCFFCPKRWGGHEDIRPCETLLRLIEQAHWATEISLPRRIAVEGIEAIRAQTALRTRVTFPDGTTKMAKVLLDWGCMAPSLVNPRFVEGHDTYDAPNPRRLFCADSETPLQGGTSQFAITIGGVPR